MATREEWRNLFETFDDPFCQIIIAYAAGDAFGAYYEFLDAVVEVGHELRAKSGWPYGGVSDDTLLSLLTISAMESADPGLQYLELLRANLDKLRGLGPTTRSALGLAVKAGERGEVGNTNGAIMRAALCGLGNFSRDSLTSVIKSTHQHPDAIYYALKMADLFGGAPIPSATKPDVAVGLDPAETFQAVVYVVSNSKSVNDAYEKACALGGDTDTVAALSGALYLARFGDEDFLNIHWLQDVDWSEVASGIDIAVRILRRSA